MGNLQLSSLNVNSFSSAGDGGQRAGWGGCKGTLWESGACVCVCVRAYVCVFWASGCQQMRWKVRCFGRGCVDFGRGCRQQVRHV